MGKRWLVISALPVAGFFFVLEPPHEHPQSVLSAQELLRYANEDGVEIIYQRPPRGEPPL